MSRIMYARDCGNQVSLYDENNREYARVNGSLVSYTSSHVITSSGPYATHHHVYDADGNWVRDIQI